MKRTSTKRRAKSRRPFPVTRSSEAAMVTLGSAFDKALADMQPIIPLDPKYDIRLPEPQRVVVNTAYGGFGLSYEAVMLYARLAKVKLYGYTSRDPSGKLDLHRAYPVTPEQIKGLTGRMDRAMVHYSTKPIPKNGVIKEGTHFSPSDIKRDDVCLVEVVKQLGEAANGAFAKLAVVEVPSGVKWDVEEYDGREHIAEQHRCWYAEDQS